VVVNQAIKVSGRELGGVDVASFYGFSIEFWKCSDRVVLVVFHFIAKRKN